MNGGWLVSKTLFDGILHLMFSGRLAGKMQEKFAGCPRLMYCMPLIGVTVGGRGGTVENIGDKIADLL